MPGRPTVRSAASVQAVGELTGFDPETLGQFEDRRQSRLAATALDPPDARQVDAGRVRQPVLG